MTPTFEQTIEIINALPKSEQQKVFEWAEKQKKFIEKSTAKDEQAKFQLAMKWIEKHKEEFDGQWFVLDGNKLISHGNDAKSVCDEARAKGIKVPFLKRVKAKMLPWGGW